MIHPSRTIGYDNDPFLDWEYEKRSMIAHLAIKLEQRLQYWREKQEKETLERYRAITSI